MIHSALLFSFNSSYLPIDLKTASRLLSRISARRPPQLISWQVVLSRWVSVIPAVGAYTIYTAVKVVK